MLQIVPVGREHPASHSPVSSLPYSVVSWGWWDGTGQDGTGWNSCGCTAPKSIPTPPRLPGAPAAAEKALFVLPHPPGRSREMPSAVNHPALLRVRPSPADASGPDTVLAPLCQALSRQWDQGTRGNMCCPSPQICPWQDLLPQTQPQPSAAPSREHRPPQGCLARTVPRDLLGDFGVPQPYLRVRSLFQAWQLMGSSRKLW